MESSLQHASYIADELDTSLATNYAAESREEEEHHIHMPGPSLWPLILSVAILVAVVGLLFIPDAPWLTIVAAPFVLVGILGWGLEDPMAAPKEKFYPATAADAQAKFKIGQDVVDKNGARVGTVHGRFNRYLLVDRGGIFITAYYIPKSVIQDNIQNNTLHLSVSESELIAMGAKALPDDLYNEPVDNDLVQVRNMLKEGVPMFARGALSPAETGHYNYGPNYPGINTDASGSYDRSQVVPNPQSFVGERRKVYKATPSRATS